MATNSHSTYTAEGALARLKEGNARFVSGRARFPTVQKEVLAELAKGQQPYATILGCSDSRVPPELVFDAGFGELFVVRVAGNVLGPSILGTLQYAGTHLHTPLFVVMGHEGCGAVKAAIATKFPGDAQKSRIALLLENILPALDGLDRTASRGAAPSGGGSQRATDGAGAARNAGGESPRGRGRHEAGRRGVRPRYRRGTVPGLGTILSGLGARWNSPDHANRREHALVVRLPYDHDFDRVVAGTECRQRHVRGDRPLPGHFLGSLGHGHRHLRGDAAAIDHPPAHGPPVPHPGPTGNSSRTRSVLLNLGSAAG